MNAIQLDVSAYETAEKLVRHHRGKLVFGGKVRPQWIDGGSRFWYRHATPEGRRFVLVDPAAGSRAPAFDHERLAAALATASGQEVDAAALPFFAIEPGDRTVEFDAFDKHWRCALDTYECERAKPRPAVAYTEVTSPDQRHTVFRRDDNLWARSLADGREWALTTDGETDHDYGTAPDWFHFGTLIRKIGFPSMPAVALWSPDSTKVVTHRTDQRGVRRTHLIEALPEDGGAPRLHTQRYAFPGDERLPLAELVVLDVETGEVVPARAEPLFMSVVSPVWTNWVWWAADGSAVYYLSQPRDVRTLRLHRLDPATGEVTTLVTESAKTRVEPNQWGEGQKPLVEVLSDGGELLWYSQRDGWGHLYLYDAHSGELRGQVTSGDWAVREILHIDEERREVYFVAAGLIADDPYRRTVCRIGLDGSGFVRLTDDDLDHVVTVAENKKYFVDSTSTVDTPPVITVRDWDGRVMVELERADISRLVATGWTPPERFRVKAADGKTDIYGVLHLPHGFDPGRRYPVLDHPYPGPQRHRVSPAFDQEVFGYDAETMAALGFVVVAVDGRGTPGRDKAFFDHSYGSMGDAGLVDHVAALRQLAETRPWMDLDRVGIFGDSAGGYATVRAMCAYPEVFKVGVAGCAANDMRYLHAAFGETYHGLPSEVDYATVSNVDIADRLEGKLLLTHGGMDTNVLPDQTMRLAEKLIAADKDFELVFIPGAEHLSFGYEHHLYRRRWDFLVRHLMGVEPPHYRLRPFPIDAEMIADWF